MINDQKTLIKSITLGMALTLLTACDPEKPHLEGKRESFVDAFQNHPQCCKKGTVQKPRVLKNTQWPLAHPGEALALDTQSFLSSVLWKKTVRKNAQAPVNPNFSVNNDHVFVLTDEDTCLQIDLKTGQEVWRYSLKDSRESLSNGSGGIFAQDQYVSFITSGSTLVVLDTALKKECWKIPLEAPSYTYPVIHGTSVYVVLTNNVTLCFDLVTGKERWRHSGLTEETVLLGQAAPVFDKEILFITYSSGEVFALNPKTGDVLWTDTLVSSVGRKASQNIHHIKARPVTDGKNTYAISFGGKLSAHDLASGERIYQKDIASSVTPLQTNNVLFIVDHDAQVYALDKRTGDALWILKLKESLKKESKTEKMPVFLDPLLVNDKIFMLSMTGQIVIINALTGVLESQQQLSSSFNVAPVVANGFVLLQDKKGVLTVYGMK